MKDNPLKSQADKLIQQIEQQRAGQTLSLNKLAKTQSTTDVVLNAPPELQVAFVESVVEAYAKLGTPKGKKATEWFYSKAVPSGSAAVVNLLLRRQLPFTDEILAGIFEKLARMSFLSVVEFNEPVARAFEKYAAKHPVSPRLRKAAAKYADVIAVKHVAPAKAAFWKEEWGFPSAEDKRVAARIGKALRR